MNPPVFPKEFMEKCCPLVADARYWRKIYNVKDRSAEDDLDFAQCAFSPAGFGLKCEQCDVFMSRPKMKPIDDFLEPIKKFYADMKAYEEWCSEQDKLLVDNGAGI